MNENQAALSTKMVNNLNEQNLQPFTTTVFEAVLTNWKQRKGGTIPHGPQKNSGT